MPAPPEFGDAFGDIGVVEVGHELKAEHTAKAGGHVGVAGEVEVQLEGEGHHAQPRTGHGELFRGERLVAVPEHTHIVGDEQFLGQTYHEDLHAGGELVRGGGTRVDLIAQILVFDDGAGDELGEQGDKSAEVENGALGTGVAPVHIHGVAHGLEGVEGDADGQMDAQNGGVDADGLQRAGQKVPILEEHQQQKVEEDRAAHDHLGRRDAAGLFIVLHQQAVGEVDDGGQEHDQHIFLLPPVIEEQGGHQQDQVAELPGHHEVDAQGQHQKPEHEYGGGKDHNAASLKRSGWAIEVSPTR